LRFGDQLLGKGRGGDNVENVNRIEGQGLLAAKASGRQGTLSSVGALIAWSLANRSDQARATPEVPVQR
jgi:hypothetical protein